MWIEAIISQDDCTSLAGQLFPLSVHLGAADSEHYLLLSSATGVSLVEGRGLRFTCNAQIRWPVLGMDLPINVDGLTVLVEPSVPEGSECLFLGITLERANVSWLPALVDAKIMDAINDALQKRSPELSWNFAEALSHEFPLPELVQPLRALDLQVGWGKVRVTAEALVLVVSFRALALMNKQTEPLLPSADVTRASLPRRVVRAPLAIDRPSPQTVVIASALLLTAGYLTLQGARRLLGRPRHSW